MGPAVAGIMSNQVPQNEQGELQGINASVSSIGAIIGPLIMTQSFTWFTQPTAPVYFPGIAFFVAGSLSVIALALFISNMRMISPPGPAQSET